MEKIKFIWQIWSFRLGCLLWLKMIKGGLLVKKML